MLNQMLPLEPFISCRDWAWYWSCISQHTMNPPYLQSWYKASLLMELWLSWRKKEKIPSLTPTGRHSEWDCLIWEDKTLTAAWACLCQSQPGSAERAEPRRHSGPANLSDSKCITRVLISSSAQTKARLSNYSMQKGCPAHAGRAGKRCLRSCRTTGSCSGRLSQTLLDIWS